nr:xylulose kinase-1 [Tanacetum cinerariifolium]
MVAYLSKSDASEGFNQIIDFLNGISIKYALTVNPNIYVSYIKQFWTTVAVKKVNDVIRLQALVDKTKVVVTEATIRKALCLDDEEGVECLPNEEIFTELARMGYEKPSTKLTFYKAFFSSQWKLLMLLKMVIEHETEPAEVQEVVDVVTTAKLITKVVTAASETITAASINITAVEAQVPAVTLTVAPARVTAAPSRSRKGLAELNKNIDWDEAIDHVKKKAKEDPSMKRYQVLKRKPQTEAQARKNMIVYLKNVAGFKMDYFKGMSYDDICPIFEAKWLFYKRQKKRLKKKRADLVKERFSTTKPKNFYDDFLLVTLGAMFEKLDIHAQIWKNQRSVDGPAKVKGWKLLESCGVQIITFTTTQLILLVERKYPLTIFTLNQMLNAVRLEVEEESEVSLELLRFIRQQHQEGHLE